MTQAPPDESTRPCTSIGALGKAQALFGKALDNRVCAAGLLEQTKCQLHGTAYLVIGIQDDASLIVVAQANRERKPQFTLLRLVELTALEAPAQKMEFGLRHRSFETEKQAVVEVARVVATIGVDHESMSKRTQFEQAMPVQVRARQARHFQCKHCTHLPHRDIRHQRLEVLAARHLRPRLTEIPVQRTDRRFRPTQCQRLVLQRILALGALLMVSHLGQCRLPDIDVRRLALMLWGDLAVHRKPPRSAPARDRR
ncbi:hypothetical protein AWB67_07636 [Caballeronia terrestris]|uniref:Uncharacterized protein n=1 Tax=Caballeronia terrestris TaxID=1226301 RepID=A0A158L5S7_9BURK|nr:hypothetical protein AWB67_07636 [Caballeronia terrestris]